MNIKFHRQNIISLGYFLSLRTTFLEGGKTVNCTNTKSYARPYLVLNFPDAVLRQQTSGLQTPTLHGFGSLKTTGVRRFLGVIRCLGVFLRFPLLISSAGDSTIVSAKVGEDSSVIVSACSASCAISVGEIAILVFFRLTVLFRGVLALIPFTSSIVRAETFSIFRETSLFTDGATFGERARSSSSSYFCFSCAR